MAGNKIPLRIHLFRESFTRMLFAFLDLDPSGGGAVFSYFAELIFNYVKTFRVLRLNAGIKLDSEKEADM